MDSSHSTIGELRADPYNRLQSLVTDKELSLLAPRLGREWRSFMRSELVINQWQIDDVENDGSLPVNEKIYKLLRIWKNRRKHECTVSCLVEHLKNFECEINTWEFLLEEQEGTTADEPVPHPILRLNIAGTADDSADSILNSSTVSQEACGLPPESPYHLARKGGTPGQAPKFRFVVELTDDIDIVNGCEDHLHFKRGTKLDVVNQFAHSYLSRDIDGNIFHIQKDKCRKADMFCPPVLTENTWFHERVERTQLEELFEGKEVGTFLIRHASQPGNFAISVKGYSDVLHFKIDATSTGYTVSGDHYHSFKDLISTYHGVSVYSTPDGKVFLQKPLPKE